LFSPRKRAVFVYGFAKSDRDNIDANEQKEFKEAARHVLSLTDKQIKALIQNGDLSRSSMKTKYRSDALAAIHETMGALRKVGAIDKQTMRRFDDACLTPVQSLSPKQIKALRVREHVSQTVFANYLNVTPNLVSKWERGEKRPSGPALKLLSLVDKRGIGAVA
jgi:putative transcriptional regulator